MSDIGSEKTPMYILIGVASVIIVSMIISRLLNQRKDINTQNNDDDIIYPS